MRLVVEMPESEYKKVKEGRASVSMMRKAIRNGTPLPKGHGRLIDADRLRNEMEKDVRKAMSFTDLEDFVFLAPVVVEADKQEGNG